MRVVVLKGVLVVMSLMEYWKVRRKKNCIVLRYLDLETLRPSATTGTLEFPALRLNVWLLVLVWAETEVLDSLSGVLWTPEEEGVGTSWGSQGELVESKSLTAGSNDTGTSSSSESESGDGDLWGLQ